MPLVRFDVVEGRNDNEIKDLLDAAHRAVLSAFHVPERDRYQIYHEHRHPISLPKIPGWESGARAIWWL